MYLYIFVISMHQFQHHILTYVMFVIFFLLLHIKHHRTFTNFSGVSPPLKTLRFNGDVCISTPISNPNPNSTSISSTQRLRVPTAGDSWLFVANSTATGSWKAQPQIETYSKSPGKWWEKRRKMRSCEKIWVKFMQILKFVEVLSSVCLLYLHLKTPKPSSDACF